MEIPHFILERLEKNEEVVRKFNEIEVSILSILNFKDFLEKLLSEISSKFSIPYTWITIIKDVAIADQFHSVQNSELLERSIAFISHKKFCRITENVCAPILANSRLDRFNDLLPEAVQWQMGSLTVAPITLDGELVGSISQADPNPNRFKPGIDTSLLEQLALKVSLCLSNVTAHERLKFLAYHDPLTSLLNRGVMERVLKREFERSKRYKAPLSLLFVDLDDFKSINDTHGHDIGDRALCHVADCLTRLKRQSDVVARFAGDEFVAILPSTDLGQAEHYIERVKKTLKLRPMTNGEITIPISLSHGLAAMPGPHKAPMEMLKSADNQLYLAKAQKNNIH